MTGPPLGFAQLRWLHTLACLIGIIGGCVAIGLGITGVDASSSRWLIVAGASAVLIAVILMAMMPPLLRIEATLTRQLTELRELRSGIAQHSASLTLISENTGLSDAAKSITHREQEVQALRNAIHEDIGAHKWEAALKLIDEMERRFGHKEEADAIREELDNARGDAIQARLTEAIDVIEDHFKVHEWDRAQTVIDRLMHALPGNAKVASLYDRMKLAKEQHKQQLKAAWDEATRRSDTDRAIDLLKELDQYLSPAEAHALQSSARHVFKDKLLQLGVQFRFAVTEKRWNDALTTGLELIRDFPNARMANEAREALDTLRERARQQGEAAEPARS